MNLVDSELQDLTINLDDTEIKNDLRVLIPNYSYSGPWKEFGSIWYAPVLTYHDLVKASLDSESIRKYGRRSKINKYQVMDASFEEAWVENQKQKHAEPYYSLGATIPGIDANVEKCLNTKISDVLTVTNAVSGIDNEYMVESYELEIRPGYLQCKLGLKEMDTDQQLDLFRIDTDSIDGDHIIGW